MPRAQRGFALSAARAELFNALLARRVADATWDRALDGEVWMLDRTHSVFGPEPFNDDLAPRASPHSTSIRPARCGDAATCAAPPMCAPSNR